MNKLISQRKRTQRKISFKISSSARKKIKINKSNRYLAISIIDTEGKIMYSLSSSNKKYKEEGLFSYKNKRIAKALSDDAVTFCENKNLKELAFDRSGYKYHGVIKLIGDTLKEKGIVL